MPASGRTRSIGWRFLLGNLAFWTVFAIVSGRRIVAAAAPIPQPQVEAVIVQSYVQAYVWAGLTPLILWLAARSAGVAARRAHRIALFSALALVVAAAATAGAYLVSGALSPGPAGEGDPGFAAVVRAELPGNLLIYLLVLGVAIARESAEYDRRRSEHLARVEATSAELQKQLAEAQLAVLRSQVNPHFLFNTLNAVSALVERDPAAAQTMIARLAALLRHSLDGAEEREVPLRHDLRFLREYLEIFELRYDGRLRTSIDAAPEALDALVPTLILQPLVENAMKHGIAGSAGYGTVEISARTADARLILRVVNTVPRGEAPAPGTRTPGGPGIGLRSVRTRLASIYGAEARLTVDFSREGYAVAEVGMPLRDRPTAPAASASAAFHGA